MRLLHPTYDDIHNACVGLAHQIQLYELQLDVIVGVSRGGLMPANTLSQILDVPLLPVCYSSKKGKGDDKNHQNILPVLADKKILILDDICDSGSTLKEINDFYMLKNDNKVYTASIYFKSIENPPIIPNLIWVTIPEDSDWVIFPWETHSLDIKNVRRI